MADMWTFLGMHLSLLFWHAPAPAGTLLFPALLLAAMFFTSLFFTYRDSFFDALPPEPKQAKVS